MGKTFRRLCKAVNALMLALQMVAILCALAQPLYAYVDPGSGLFAFQIISSTFAGLIFLLRKRGRQIFKFFVRRSKEKPSGTTD